MTYAIDVPGKFGELFPPDIHTNVQLSETIRILGCSTLNELFYKIEMKLCCTDPWKTWTGRFSLKPGGIIVVEVRYYETTEIDRFGVLTYVQTREVLITRLDQFVQHT